MSSEDNKNGSKPIFRDISADDEPEMTEVESLCMNCGKNGITRLFLTRIPHYKDMMLSSFECEHCGYKNNETQDTGMILNRGIKIVLEVTDTNDLNRQIIKSDFTSIRIPHLEFEIPARSQEGEITTLEGIIDRSIRDLEQDQNERREINLELAEKIEKCINNLQELKHVENPFKIIFEDISGKCNVENLNYPKKDSKLVVTTFKRTKEQNHSLGIYEENEDVLLKPIHDDEFPLEELESEVLNFPTNCPDCSNPCETNMKLTKIPHFKEVIIMATTCENCGHRTNEVKSGAGIEPHGVKIEVKVTGKEDFSRDLLKSDTCTMEIPELDLEVGPATLGGRFTTVEGIIIAMKDQLSDSTAFMGDSSDDKIIERMENFIRNIDKVLEGEMEVTLILDDPAGNSYIQSLSDNEEDDKLKITKYKRSYEQNDVLGLNDMKVDNY